MVSESLFILLICFLSFLLHPSFFNVYFPKVQAFNFFPLVSIVIISPRPVIPNWQCQETFFGWHKERAGKGDRVGMCVCAIDITGYRLGILLIHILQCTRQLLTTKNCLLQNINGTETLLLAYNSNWLLIFSHGC